MVELTLEAALAERLEPQVAQFEANAALWRLEAGRHAHRLIEDNAIGALRPEHLSEAQVAIEGIEFEIDRFQGFTRAEGSQSLSLLVRLAEVAAGLETARRRLARALELTEPQAPPQRSATASA